jgi:hypothetical protein
MAWHTATLECHALAHLALQDLPPAVSDLSRQLIQLLVRQSKGDDLSSIFDNMVGMERPQGFGREVTAALHAAEDAFAAACADGSTVPTQQLRAATDWSPTMLRGALDRQQANTYGIFGPQRRDIACCMFATLFHLFNHDCIPNSAVDRLPLPSRGTPSAQSDGGARNVCGADGTGWWSQTFAMRALYDIPAGVELTTSYVDTAESTAVRSSQLSAHYGFNCVCRRCNADAMEELDIVEALDAMKCPDVACAGFVTFIPESQEFRCLFCSTPG